ncbi:hypothetical protein SLEP1_g7232 [Rubroshorea leprosula]|uniref:Cobalamin-independent methionine synthase MetE N-terminal domain-containing protein n=1 Tax=Rubroshorea leprosula TaxID=152421 RepID=A0AAV5I2B3_9ROSI|nr:hypothetical protein SLEP1_g7232 [Rubroshorea leprosula]
MASHIVGYLPRVGAPERAQVCLGESFWDSKTGAEELQTVVADLRSAIWKRMADVGIKYIPRTSNTFHTMIKFWTLQQCLVMFTSQWLGAMPLLMLSIMAGLCSPHHAL